MAEWANLVGFQENNVLIRIEVPLAFASAWYLGQPEIYRRGCFGWEVRSLPGIENENFHNYSTFSRLTSSLKRGIHGILGWFFSLSKLEPCFLGHG